MQVLFILEYLFLIILFISKNSFSLKKIIYSFIVATFRKEFYYRLQIYVAQFLSKQPLQMEF